jgi:hypothetical protein
MHSLPVSSCTQSLTALGHHCTEPACDRSARHPGSCVPLNLLTAVPSVTCRPKTSLTLLYAVRWNRQQKTAPPRPARAVGIRWRIPPALLRVAAASASGPPEPRRIADGLANARDHRQAPKTPFAAATQTIGFSEGTCKTMNMQHRVPKRERSAFGSSTRPGGERCLSRGRLGYIFLRLLSVRVWSGRYHR